ncbi:superoxide dismutase [Cardiobacterium valvarum]|uniref:Superoxide dismutase n=1 Tax=Cardiobacterium valvarum F0432 TaxID=797473 RepID=G9ZI36_9GAMM|nr:superoxide dismutase [Cardiobacterium valvarum]EHM52278.1 putative superoxide dismutase, Mn [Cardiobacterium valvarum F0432]
MTTYTFADLPYAYDALEPVIDAVTMQIHHDRHHKAYYDNFLTAVKGNPLNGQPLETLFTTISKESAALRNNAGGYYNHNHYWNVMRPHGSSAPSGALLDAINSTFGSVDACKAAFKDAGIKQFGSGWAWLIVGKDGKLAITSTPNQDNPLMDTAAVQGTPILGCDVWEHAYYLHYQNKRPDYLDAWWQIVNWDYVAELYAKATA